MEKRTAKSDKERYITRERTSLISKEGGRALSLERGWPGNGRINSSILSDGDDDNGDDYEEDNNDDNDDDGKISQTS